MTAESPRSSFHKKLAVEITRFVHDWQPGWVECALVDAGGREHRFLDKVPIFSAEVLDRMSRYPVPGHIRCRILAEFIDVAGRNLNRISTEVESNEGVSEFVVLSCQVSD